MHCFMQSKIPGQTTFTPPFGVVEVETVVVVIGTGEVDACKSGKGAAEIVPGIKLWMKITVFICELDNFHFYIRFVIYSITPVH